MMTGDSFCGHVDGEHCEKCWPPKSKSTTKDITIHIHLSRIGNKVFTVLDAAIKDIHDFGINYNDFHQLDQSIANVFEYILNKK